MAAKGKGGPNTDVYKELFKEADKNGDGSLTTVELRDLLKQGGSCMSDQQVADTFVFFDGAQGDKRISFEEFCSGLDQIVKFVQELKKLFDSKDKSGDGYLDRNELKCLLDESGRNFKPDEVTSILQMADKNGDNKISWEEFMNACT